MSRVPILVILGATGSGKSRLAIELAQRFSGEIISADSMQVYKCLDIVTAKVTPEERRMAPHHMLDVVDPLTNFTVLDFRKMALPIMDDLLARKKLPIVVGGTNYYIESLLWKILVTDPESGEVSEQSKENTDSIDDGDDRSPTKRARMESVFKESNEELYKRLKEIDPEMARRLHPNNRRKVIRSLEVFENHGRTHSEILKEQRTAGGCGLGGPLRHSNSILLWLRCDVKVLGERLDRRVDTMMETGLVQELLDFHERYNQHRIKINTSPDYTKGIFQNIGFKEFHAYFMLPKEERLGEKGQELMKQGVEDLKQATKKYAKKQDRWVMNRLMRRTDRQVPPLYALDCSDLKQWDSCILQPAVDIISSVMRGEKPKQQILNENVKNEKVTDSSNEELHYCEVCERLFVGELQWNQHIKGAKHKKVLKRKEKLKTEEVSASCAS